MNTTSDLPRFVLDLLAAAPRRGEGLNLWLFRAARVLHSYRAEGEIVALLRAAVAGEAVKCGEIERAVSRSRAAVWPRGETLASGQAWRWPNVNIEQRETVISQAEGFGVVDLWESSPVRFDTSESYADQVVRDLFAGNPLLCCGESEYEFATKPLTSWLGELAGLQFIVPSPMTARTGFTQEGRESEHTLSNTGPRRFLIVEQDAGTSDEQAAILRHLARRMPLTVVVHSGGKSLHGWFFCEGRAEETVRDFMSEAVSLGGDRATWTRSQFVRMPGGQRADGRSQTIFYFNPQSISRLRKKL